MQFRLPPEFLQAGIHGTLHERLHFRRARIQLQERLLCQDLHILLHPFVAAVHNHVCRTLKIRCRLVHGFL